MKDPRQNELLFSLTASVLTIESNEVLQDWSAASDTEIPYIFGNMNSMHYLLEVLMPINWTKNEIGFTYIDQKYTNFVEIKWRRKVGSDRVILNRTNQK